MWGCQLFSWTCWSCVQAGGQAKGVDLGIVSVWIVLILEAVSLGEVTKEGRTEQVEVQAWALGLSDSKYLGRWKRAHVVCADSPPFPTILFHSPGHAPSCLLSARSCCLSGTDFCWLTCPAAIQVWAWQIRPRTHLRPCRLLQSIHVLKDLWGHLRSIWLYQDWLLCWSLSGNKADAPGSQNEQCLAQNLFSSEVVTSKLKTWKNRERAEISADIYISLTKLGFFCLRVCPAQYCSVGYLDSFLHATDLKNEVYVFPKFPVST